MKFPSLKLSIAAGMLCAAAGLHSCDVVNPAEEIPTYIHIDSIQSLPMPDMGSASAKITGAYVYLGNDVIGVFELPATIPLLMDGPELLQIVPAVDNGGRHSQLISYPYYAVDTMTIAPAPGTTINIQPVTGYRTGTNIKFSEDFESGSQFKVKLSGDTSIARTTEAGKVFEGAGSGYLYLNSGSTAEITSLEGVSLSGGVNTYIELDYKNTMDFQVGIQAIGTSGDNLEYRVGFIPRDTWNKVYIPITDFIGANPALGYYIVFKATPKEGAANGYVLFDNIKIVTNL